MGVLADLLHTVQGEPPLVATHAVVGRRFTGIAGAAAGAAQPATAGVAYTGQGEADAGFNVALATAPVAGAVLGRPLLEVAGSLLRPVGHRPVAHGLDAGAAALNALLAAQLRESGRALGAENGLDLVLRYSAGRRLAMVGHFPYLDRARLAAAECWVLELQPEGDDLPATAAPEILPQADVVGITGSTLANGTLEGTLALCRRDATVVMIGPTTPLSPVLFDYGVSVLCGVLVDDPAQTMAGLADETAKPSPRLPGTRVVSLERGASAAGAGVDRRR